MTSEKHDEKAIFNAARKIDSSDARAEYLYQVCGADQNLCERVNTLLRAYEEQASFLDSPPGGNALPTIDYRPITEQPGTVIGPYKLLQQIGEGGMGVVFMAEQSEPIQRTVALKIIKPGMDTRQVIARFEAERQALAMMDHPNIAKVLDAGTTDSGRPYFVMELVKGVPITKYCDEKHLPLRARLELLLPVCQAVQHAHQKGVIHRDIKPTNVLVAEYDDRAVPKVIDFGVAKATAQKLTDRTMFTEFGQVLGTVEYMSPEQAKLNQLDIDTRSDIYSLGVLLYELLTGSTPFGRKRLNEAAFDEALRIIREEEPQKPSTRLSTTDQLPSIAANRHSEPARLSKVVRGELDWVVMKALEKDRNRRYETANDLAADVQRYLHDELVQARPATRMYRFKKFARRNKAGVLAGSTIVAALALGVIGTSLGLVRAESHRRSEVAARRLAQKNFDEARATVRQLLNVSNEDLYDVPGLQPLRVKLMQSAVEHYESFVNGSSLDPAPRAELARLYVMYGFTAEDIGANSRNVTMPLFQKARAIQEDLLREHPHDRALRSDLAWTFTILSWRRSRDPVIAQEAADKAIALFEELVAESPGDPLAHSDLALILWLSGTRPTHEADRQRSLAIREQLVKEYPYSAEFRRNLANSLHVKARRIFDTNLDQALALIERATVLRRAVVADIETKLPGALLPARPRDSAAHLQKVTLIWTKRDVAYGPREAAGWCLKQHRYKEALTYADQAVKELRVVVQHNPAMGTFTAELGSAFNTSWEAARNLGDLEGVKKREADAIDYWEAIAAVPGSSLSAQQRPALATVHANLATLLRERGRLDEAIVRYRRSIELNPKLGWVHSNLGVAYEQKGDSKSAIPSFRRAIELEPGQSWMYLALGGAYEKTGDLKAALANYRQTAELAPKDAWAQYVLARFLANCTDLELRNPQEALAAAEKAVEFSSEPGGYWCMLGVAKYRNGNWQAAIDALTKSLEPGNWGNGVDLYFLAMAHWQLDHKDEARKWYDKAVEWMDKNQPNNEELRRFRAEAEEMMK